MTKQPATPRGFPPLLGESPHTLVLGSFPSVASLAAQQYYAHPRNAFWPIMGMLLGFDATLPYPERTRALTACGIALWDVIASCHRPGSRDDAIVGPSVEPNDIVGHRHQRHHRGTTLSSACLARPPACASFAAPGMSGALDVSGPRHPHRRRKNRAVARRARPFGRPRGVE